MDIEGLGDALAAKLVEAGLVKRLSDLYKLTEADILSVRGMGKRSAGSLLREIAASRERPLPRFLCALGIPMVGEQMAARLCRRFASLDELMRASRSDLRKTRGLGPKTADSIVAFFSAEGNRAVIREMRSAGLTLGNPLRQRRPHGRLAGATFVFTGKLRRWTRAEARRLLEAVGARVAGEVSRRTDYVVVGEGPGSKLERARSLGLKILTEVQFAAMLRRAREDEGATPLAGRRAPANPKNGANR
jgi:DNA ligase (NAD+)